MENTAPKAQSINIMHIVRVFLSYWLVLGFSAFLFLSAGLVYYKYTSRVYSVSARIIINTSRTRGVRGSSNYVNVNEMMLDNKELSNEINLLKSSPFIKEVIEEMNLFTSYYDKSDHIPRDIYFGLYNIYKSSPFLVIVDENSPQPLGTIFSINIIDENTFHLNAYNELAPLYYSEDQSISNEDYYYFINETFKFGEQITTDYSSFRIVLNSNYIAEEYQGRNLYFKFNSPKILAYKFQDALSIGGASHLQSSIANISFEWESVAIAEEFLTGLIDNYIRKNLEKKNYNANTTIAYIDQQLANVQSTLGQSESRLQNFRSTRDVVDIDHKTSNIHSQIQRLEESQNSVQTRYQNLLRLKSYFDENKNSETFIAPISIGMSDATLANLIQELTTLSREKQDLISTNQLRNPRIKTIDANMASIKKVITDNISFSLSSCQNELSDINSRISRLNIEYSKLPQTQRQLLELEREFNINDGVYSSLLNQRIQAKIMKVSNRSDCEILEPVRYDGMTSPNIQKIAILSLFLGIFFPSVYIVIVNFLSQKIRSKEDLKNFSHLSSIGDIPHNEKQMNNVISNLPRSPIVERFHTIRSNLIYYLFGEVNKTVLITSTLPNEGKSFTSLNLALSFASSNKKTVLINFDLRKTSKIVNEFNLNTLIGLDLYLIQQATLEDILLETPYENLDYIHNGNIPHDPGALLSSPHIKELFESLREEYEYIIIDTPPFGMVSDAFLLMQYSDINLYVSRLGVVTKKALTQCMEELKAKETKDIYLVRNDIMKMDRTYADRYAYGETKKKVRFYRRLFKSKKKS